jgi:mRNA interferase MazF
VSRGEVVAVVLPGAYGKPRPALVVQDDAFEGLPSVTVLPITSDIRDLPPLRISIAAGPGSGLRRPSQLQIDKIMTVPRAKLGPRIGSLDDETMKSVELALGRFLGIR